MMLIAKFTFICLLFLLMFLTIYKGLEFFVSRSKARFRLHYMQNSRLSNRFLVYIARYNVLYRHITDLLESTNAKTKLTNLVLLSFLLFLGGFTAGAFYFSSIKGVVLLCSMLGSMPYLILRMKLINLQMKTRLNFLPAIEIFYQYYVLSGGHNIRNALYISLAENRIMYPMKPVFEQLYRNLTTNRGVDDSLRIFALTLGHMWGYYFVNILRVGLEEGNDIAAPIKELIHDMRKAQRSDQVERNRLLEIRIANFTPIIFLAIFLSINFKINYHNAYYFYVIDTVGRNMLLDALLLIFVSFLMGVYLSIRRM